MIKMKARSWILLFVLALVVAFAAGVRQGYIVAERNMQNRAMWSNQEGAVGNRTPLSLPPLREVTNTQCGVTYLMPESIASASGLFDVRCDQSASDAAVLWPKSGYQTISLASPGGTMTFWIKSPAELMTLMTHTLKLMPR